MWVSLHKSSTTTSEILTLLVKEIREINLKNEQQHDKNDRVCVQKGAANIKVNKMPSPKHRTAISHSSDESAFMF